MSAATAPEPVACDMHCVVRFGIGVAVPVEHLGVPHPSFSSFTQHTEATQHLIVKTHLLRVLGDAAGSIRVTIVGAGAAIDDDPVILLNLREQKSCIPFQQHMVAWGGIPKLCPGDTRLLLAAEQTLVADEELCNGLQMYTSTEPECSERK